MARRAKYSEVSVGAKNISQINASPILKWNSAEIYGYLVTKHLLLNNAYRKGLFRVGCMVCPMSSDWWDSLSGLYYPNEVRSLRDKVERYVARAKPEKERKKYIERITERSFAEMAIMPLCSSHFFSEAYC